MTLADLKNYIAAKIFPNGIKAITASVLKDVLTKISDHIVADIYIENGNCAEFDGITEAGIYRYIRKDSAEAGHLVVSKAGGYITQRLFKTGGLTLRRNGVEPGSVNAGWGAWYPESQQDYTDVTVCTPRRWLDGSPVYERTFPIKRIAKGQTYSVPAIDILQTVFDICGTTDLADTRIVRRLISHPGIDISISFNNDPVTVNNTGFDMIDTVVTVKTCPRLTTGMENINAYSDVSSVSSVENNNNNNNNNGYNYN